MIGIASRVKIKDFLDMIGQGKYAIDITNMDYDRLISAVNDVFNHRAEIRRQLESKTEDMKERALLNAKLVKELIEHTREG